MKSMKTRSINDDGISSNRKTVFDDTLKVGMLDAIMVMHGSLTVLILVRKIAVT